MNYRPHGPIIVNNALARAWRNTLAHSWDSRVASAAANWGEVMLGPAWSGGEAGCAYAPGHAPHTAAQTQADAAAGVGAVVQCPHPAYLMGQAQTAQCLILQLAQAERRTADAERNLTREVLSFALARLPSHLAAEVMYRW